MEPRLLTARLRAPAVRLGLGAAAVAAGVLGAFAATPANFPDWILGGDADVLFDAGYHDATGQYDLPFDAQTPRVDLSYTSGTNLSLTGFVLGDGGPTIFEFVGAQTVDDAGVEHIALADRGRKPQWRFDGTMAPDGGDITGTYTRAEGFAGFPAASGPLTISRWNPATGPGQFRLRMRTTTDTKGRVKGGITFDGSESLALVNLHGGRTLAGGKIVGKVKTSKTAVTTGKVKIRGKDWSLSLTGPLDAGGFHALADLRGAGLRLDDLPILLPAFAGPEEPSGGGGPPPKDANGTASVNDTLGTVEVSARVSIGGAKRNATIQFPDSDTSGTIHADPAAAIAPQPRRFFATFGGKIYGTATAPADVAIQVVRFSRIGGEVIELHCTGTIVESGGKSKTIDVQVLAIVE